MNERPKALPIMAMFGFLAVLGGLLGWVLSGMWQFAAVGAALFLAFAIIAAAVDNGERG